MAHILIVDDEANIRTSLAAVITADGEHTTSAVETVAEAREKLSEQAFDVVLTDIILPRESGVELLKHVVATFPEIPVIMMTGDPSLHNVAESVRAGAFDFLVKPMMGADIRSAIARAVHVKALHDDKRRLEQDNIRYKQDLEKLVGERTAALHESERLHRGLAQNLPGVVYRVHIREDDRMQFFNDQMEALTGYSPEELDKGEFWLIDQLILPEDRPHVIAAIKEAVETGEPFEVEYRIRTKSDDIVHFHERGNPTCGDDGDPLYIDGVILNVTDSRKTHEALLRSEQRMRSIFAASPTGIGVVVNRVFVEVNEQFCRMTGYSQEELIGQSSRMVYLSDEEHERAGQEKYRHLSKYGIGSVETRFLCKDGTIIDVLLTSAPLDPDDLSLGVTFTALDVTELRRGGSK